MTMSTIDEGDADVCTPPQTIRPLDIEATIERIHAWCVELWSANSLTLHLCDGRVKTGQSGLLRNIRDDVGRLRAEYKATARALSAEKAEVARLRAALTAENDDVCQTLGKALGYPWFKDDQETFPGATEENGVCVGDHVAASIAAEAARLFSTEKAAREEAERVNAVWRSNSRETFEALCAMRNDINERIPMPSLESDLLKGPSMWAFAEAVAKAVIEHATTAEAALAAERAAREEAERERDDLQRWHDASIQQHMKDSAAAAALVAETARLRGRVKEMEEALAPFASVAEHDIGDDETDADQFRPIQSNYNRAPKLTVGDLRRAAAICSRENSNE